VDALQEAARCIGARDASGAETALKPLLDESPEDPIALNLLGLVRLQQGQSVQAEELFHRAIEKGPHLPGPHVNLAMLYGSARAEDAITELNKALEIAPGDDQAQALLRTIVRSAAAEASRSGDKERALALMLRARQELPRDPDVLVDTALAAMDDNLYPDAEQYLLDALKVRPDFPKATYALARAYLAESKLQLAEEQMRKYLATKPDDATAQYGLGFILVAEQKVDDARTAFEKSLTLEPRQTESLFQLGEISVQKGESDRAADEFRKVLERDPRHAGALTEIGVIAFRGGNLSEAQGNLERAVALAPSYYKAHYYYALTLKKLGRQDEAEREFQIATGLQKHDTPTARIAPDRQ
jgi:tetratricopeptide (TPR) repeat protein